MELTRQDFIRHRSYIWSRAPNGWVLRFHQGTSFARRINLARVFVIKARWLNLLILLAALTGKAQPTNWQSLPVPPKQHSPWQPPATNLSTNLISAVEFLFNLGMADPRGCEYREFETVTGSVWGDTNYPKVHGWILPASGPDEPRFAISWSGLVYPATRVGPKADLTADVQELLRVEKTWSEYARTNRAVFWGAWSWSPWEGGWISQTNLVAEKILLLLRLGETDLAEKYWNGLREIRTADKNHTDDDSIVEEFAFVFAQTHFERAVCAHMRGDDRLALDDCRLLTRGWPALEEEATRRGSRLAPETWSKDGKARHYYFLEPLPELLADEERRVKEPSRRTALQIGLDKFPEQTSRIAALITDLDQVAARQWSQPGGVSLNWDPIVVALVKERDAAVEPLIHCAETDQRLTRSVSFGRDFHPARNLISVKSPAFAALSEILSVNFETPAEYRAYWQKYKSLSPAERWYQTLLDDRAGRRQWMDAAQNILSRTDGKTVYLWKNAPVPNPANRFTYVANNLRTKTNPSVADLLLRRALDIAPTNYHSSDDCWTFEDAAILGLMVAEWDHASAKNALGKILACCPALFPDVGRENWTTGCAVVPQQLAALVVAMAKLGDTTGLDAYANWARARNLHAFEDSLPGSLSPFGLFPDHPSIKAASAELFSATNSNWLVLSSSADLLRSRLVQNAAFRSLILDALADKTPAGIFRMTKQGYFSIEFKNGSESGMIQPDPALPKVGDSVSFRVCDNIARRLSRIQNLPESKIYWPEARRDAALAAIITFLKENGDNLKLGPASWLDGEDN